MKKRIISAAITAATLLSAFSGCSAPAVPVEESPAITATSSALDTYAAWLTDRLESDGRTPSGIVIGDAGAAAEYGLDLSTLSDEGFIIRRDSASDTTLIFAATAHGTDRGVRYFANYCSDEGELNVVKDEGYRIGKITIAGADLSEYVIVNPEPDNVNLSHVAEELRRHLGNACGISPEIVTEAPENGYAITFVRDESGDTYGDENFLIKSHQRGITITGGRFRGCMYGMYQLLEDYIGIKFYYKSTRENVNGDFGVPYIYEADEIVIGAEDIDFYGEGSIYSRCAYSDAQSYSPALKYNGPLNVKGMPDGFNNELFGSYGVPGNVTHGFQNYFWNTDLTEWDPNYVPGQNPCFTNEDLFDELAYRVIEDLDHRVQVDGLTPMKERYMCCIDIAHLDTPAFCMCEDCVDVYSEEGAVSGAIIRHANKMVEVLADTPYSDILVGCFAYYGTTKPPRVTKPHKNVVVNFCFYISDDKMIKVCSNHSFGDPECETNKHFTDLYDKWCEITDKTFIWYYPTTAYYFAGTNNDLFKMHGDINYLADRGTYGVMALMDTLLTNNGFVNTELSFIKEYMFQRMMWDADMSYEEFCDILKEFLFFTYGDGYESVFDYLKIMDEAGNYGGECWAGIIDQPQRRMSFTHIKNNAEVILQLYEDALRYATDSYQEMMVREIFKYAHYHIAIATHTDKWINGSEADREWYKGIIDHFTNNFAGTLICQDWGNAYPWKYVPTTGSFDYDQNPLEWMNIGLGTWNDNYNF